MKKINFYTMILTLFVVVFCFTSKASADEYVYGENLIINGDFSLGNFGFDTDYYFVDPENGGPTSLQPEGRYTVAGNPNLYHPAFTGSPAVGEKFLIVNGHTVATMTQQGVDKDYAVVWQQTVENIDPNKDYIFSFMLSSLVTTAPAQLSLTIMINEEEFTQVAIAPNQTSTWVEHTWTNMNKTNSATITIVETTKVQSGNDFGIDDIKFYTVEPACPAFDQVVTIEVTDVTCPGDDDGEIKLILNGAKPFNACISWGCEEDDQENAFTSVKTSTYTYGGLIAGYYTITVVDGNGCVYTACVLVGEPEPITAEVEFDPILCFGETTDVTVTGFGGNPPYTLFNEENVAVDTFDSDYTLYNLPAGEYNWTLGDSHGCEPFVISFEIEQPHLLETSYEKGEIACFGETADVTVFATGGVAPYKLFDGDVFAGDLVEGQITLNVPAGEYLWTVVDANGCEDEVSFELTQPELLVASYEKEDILCFEGTADVTVFAAGGTATYQLFDGDVFAGDLVDGQITLNVPAGSYLWTVVDANGCEDEVSFELTQPELLVASYEKGDILCNGGSADVTVFAVGGTAPYQLFDGDVFAGDLVDGEITLSVPADTYNWTVVDANGCEDVVSFTLTEPALLETSYEKGEIACFGETADVTVFATGGVAPYQLFDGEVFAGDLVEGQITLNIPAGEYLWTVKDVNGCEAEVSFELTQPELLVASYEKEEILCFEGTADVTVFAAGGTAPYQLFDGEVFAGDFEDGQITLNVPAGSYLWTVVDANGCEDEVSFELTQPELLEASYEKGSIDCFGGSADVTVFAVGGTAPYQLFDGDVFAGDLVDGEITLSVPAGTYNWTVVDANGCEDEVSFTLTQPDPIMLGEGVATDASCFGFEDGMFTIEVMGGTPPYFASMGTFENGVLTIEGLAAGSYTVTITDSKNCGPEEVSFEIGQPEELVITNIDVEIPLCAPDNFPPCEEPWVVNVVEYNVGTTANGGAVAANRQILSNLLGAPDTSNSPPITFVSLGFGGSIILEMGCDIVNGEGDDFLLVETSYGQGNCANYPEKADVFVAQSIDGPWSYLGEACLSTAFDLANGVDEDGVPFVLDWAKYVKVIDVSNPANFSSGSDGYDVNGILILNTPEAPTTATITVEFLPEGIDAAIIILDEDGNVVDINNLLPGNYTAYIEFEGCVSEEVEFTVDPFPTAIEADADVTNVSCFEGTDGVAEVTVSGGTAPYALLWEGLEEAVIIETEGGSYTIAGLAAGFYAITIVDANDCIAYLDFEVGQPDLLVVTEELGEIRCFGEFTTVTLDIQGGTAPYTLSDNNSDFSVEIAEAGEFPVDGLIAGEYSWTVTDANNCSVLVEFELEEPELLEAEKAFDPILCFDGTTDVTVTAMGGTGSYKLYNMEVADENLVATFNDFTVVEGLGAGSYYWIVVDENNCEAIVEFNIEQPELLDFALELDPESILCHNGLTDAIVTAIGGTAPYFLTIGEGNVIEFDDYYRVEELAPMAYSWSLTDANGCGPVDIVFEILNPDPIEITLESTTDILCHGEATGIIEVSAIGGTGALSYAIEGGEAQDNGLFEGLFAGTYVIIVTDENGCTEMIEATLTESEKLEVDLEVFDVTCNGLNDGIIQGMITGGVGPYNVCLFTECTIDENEEGENLDKSQGMMYWGLQPGTYMVKVTDQNGCVWMECVTIGEPDVLTAEYTDLVDVLCTGDDSGEVTIVVEGGNMPYTLAWEGVEAFEIEGGSYTITGLTAGSYTVYVDDANNCGPVAVEFVITEPEMALGYEIESGNVDCNGGSDGFIYILYEGGTGEISISGDLESFYNTDLPAGVYNFTLTDENGCTVDGSVTITEPAALALTIEIVDLVCEADGEEAYVSDWVWYRQGLTKAGNLPNADRSNPEVVIGEPEFGDVAGTFFSLGFGGEMIVKFDNPIANGPGNDLMIVETTFGTHTCASYPEKVDVWVAQYINEDLYAPIQGEIDVLGLGEWIYLGQGCLDAEFDFGDLPWAQYVYMQDVSDPADFGNSQISDGYDINGLIALNGSLAVSANLVATVEGGTPGYSFVWNTGAVGSMLAVNAPGTYTVTVTDANGCVIEAEVEVICGEYDGENDEDGDKLIVDETVNSNDIMSANAFPNPFRTEATIEFTLTRNATVSVNLFNLAGERVSVLYEGNVEAFELNTVRLSSEYLSSGVYFYHINTGSELLINKVVLVK